MSRQHTGPQVFVLYEDPRFNYLDAERFGDIQIVTNRDFTNNPGSRHNQDVMSDVKDALRDYDPELDFILVSPAPLVNVAAFLYLGAIGTRAVRVLRWSNRDNTYYATSVDLNLTMEMTK